MCFDVPKPWLLVCNGLIWGAAGVNILRLGIVSWISAKPDVLLPAALAVLIFLSFHFMFTSIVKKNVQRLRGLEATRLPIWQMMPLKSWLTLGFMMSLGIALKVTGAASAYFMAFFYTGLGTALTESGLRYLLHALRLQKFSGNL